MVKNKIKLNIFLILVFFLFTLQLNSQSIELIEIKKTGQYGEGFGELLVPYGSYYDPKDNKIYITDCLGEKFIVYDEYLNILDEIKLKNISTFDNFMNNFHRNKKQFFKKPFEVSESLPADITVFNNKIYVVEEFNERVSIWNKNGEFIKTIGSRGRDKYKLSHPLGIFSNERLQNIMVVDSDNNRILTYDQNFKYISEFSNSKDGFNFEFPYYGSFDNFDNIFIVDRGNNRVVRFDKNFNYISELNNFDYPHDITFDKFNNIFVADTNNGTVVVFDNNGNKIKTFSKDFLNPKVVLVFGDKLLVGDIGSQEQVLTLYQIKYD